MLGLLIVALACAGYVHLEPGNEWCRGRGCWFWRLPRELHYAGLGGLGAYLIWHGRRLMDAVERADVWFRIDTSGVAQLGAGRNSLRWDELSSIRESAGAFDLRAKWLAYYRGIPVGKGRIVVIWDQTDRTRDEVWRVLHAYRPDLVPQDASRTR